MNVLSREEKAQLHKERHDSVENFIRYLCAGSAEHRGETNEKGKFYTQQKSDPKFIAHCIELFHTQNGKCAVTNVPMTWKNDAFVPTNALSWRNRQNKPCPFQISIDRINGDAYLIGSVRLVCWYVNNGLNQYGDDIYYFFAQKAAETHAARNPGSPPILPVPWRTATNPIHA